MRGMLRLRRGTNTHSVMQQRSSFMLLEPHAQLHLLLLTFWEAKDWVQWYRTSRSLLKGLGSAVGSSLSSPSVVFPSPSTAEMGHQLQLVGVTWLEDAMTERFVRVWRKRSEEGEKRRDGDREERSRAGWEGEERRGGGGGRGCKRLECSITCSRDSSSSIRQSASALQLGLQNKLSTSK